MSVPTPVLQSYSCADLRGHVQNAPPDIVDGLIPERSVNLIVGDSGLGKSPLLMQLALSVISGLPFLNQRTQLGRVLWVDYENGESGLLTLIDTLCGFLAIPEPDPNLFRILHQPSSPSAVEREIQSFHPILTIIDALRGFDARAEQDNSSAGAMIASLQQTARRHNSATLIVHHIKKPDKQNPTPPLADTPSIMEWLLEAAGARALVNQSAIRIGVDYHKDKSSSTEIILRGHYKLRGEFGPWSIARAYDEEGEPIGYQRLTGTDLLTPAQRDRYHSLPADFSFSEAETLSGLKNGKPTAQFLKRCIAARVLEKRGIAHSKKVRYYKIG